jgi:integrase
MGAATEVSGLSTGFTGVAEGWSWPAGPFAGATYDRRRELAAAERAALAEVERLRRQWSPDHRAYNWTTALRRDLERLRAPVRDALRWTGAGRSSHVAVQSVLGRAMLERDTTYWGWSRDDWLAVLRHNGGSPQQQYVQYGITVAYLQCGHNDLYVHFRGLKRYALAAKVFGADPFEAAVARIRTEVRQWGYGEWLTDGELPSAVAALLLASRSPRLEDVTPAALHAVLGQDDLPWYLGIGVGLVARGLVKLGLLPADALPTGGTPGVKGAKDDKGAQDTLGLRGAESADSAEGADSARGAVGATTLDPGRAPHRTAGDILGVASLPDVAPAWARWCERWYETATLSPAVRRTMGYYLLRAGRWLAATHPEVTEPGAWTRELAAEYVAAVDRMTVGQWSRARAYPSTAQPGAPLKADTKDHQLCALRIFFRDGQEWGWFPRRFEPRRALATPRSVKALMGPKPRVIADDVWAKLLWAGLNLTQADLPALYRSKNAPYPLPMLRALALAWLFTGLRCNELRRLRVGCVRWQREDVPVGPVGTAVSSRAGSRTGADALTTAPQGPAPESRGPGGLGVEEVLPRDAICWLDVPVNKSKASYTKAVDRVVGDAIAAWERVRPVQLPALDAKTGEVVQFLFAYRGKQIGGAFLNDGLIPVLCRKAGVPRRDARGNITSHRARSTIASQLANAKEPMTLLELMQWLGHRDPGATLHYVDVAPTRLAKAYADAGYFARNVRAIEVLIDQQVVESGAAAKGEPWRFYDLGHGYCTYTFFDQCPHRMACAKCNFYRPKGSTQAQLLEGKANLLRLKQELPLLDEERAAVDDGVEAMDRLLTRLADVPTPDGGPPPRQRAGRGLRPLPVLPSG